MTEYWVSQGNHWCDFCKIYISKNPATIRNHELGTRHKENVAKRLTDMRKDKAAKEKQLQDATRSFQRIEAQASRSYQKDIAASSASNNPQPPPYDHLGFCAFWNTTRILCGYLMYLSLFPIWIDWEYDNTSGYYYDQHTRISYDPKSGFYYSDVLGKWVTQEEAFSAAQSSSGSKPREPLRKAAAGQPAEKKKTVKLESGSAPGHVVSGSLNPTRLVKGAPSSLAIGKRKRAGEKPKAVSAEEEAALKAREAARKRVEDREKTLLGLYGH